MARTRAQERTISQILDDLEDEPTRIYAWRLYRLERAGFDIASAVVIGHSNCDLHQAISLKEAGCEPSLVAAILA